MVGRKAELVFAQLELCDGSFLDMTGFNCIVTAHRHTKYSLASKQMCKKNRYICLKTMKMMDWGDCGSDNGSSENE